MGTRAAHGEYMAAFAPYGYMKNPEDAHQLIPDEEAAEVVKMIFTMAAEGKKKPQIARFLNEQGTPTCMEHFQSMGLKRKSPKEKEKKLWTITTIGDMLKNEVYLGKTIWNKTKQAAVGSRRHIKNDRSEWIIMEGTHEPLVSQELFDMANAKAFTHQKKNVPTGRKAQPILICPYCGRRLIPTTWGNAYRCGQAAISGIADVKHPCDKSCLRRHTVLYPDFGGNDVAEAAEENDVANSVIEEKIGDEAEERRLVVRN